VLYVGKGIKAKGYENNWGIKQGLHIRKIT